MWNAYPAGRLYLGNQNVWCFGVVSGCLKRTRGRGSSSGRGGKIHQHCFAYYIGSGTKWHPGGGPADGAGVVLPRRVSGSTVWPPYKDTAWETELEEGTNCFAHLFIKTSDSCLSSKLAKEDLLALIQKGVKEKVCQQLLLYTHSIMRYFLEVIMTSPEATLSSSPR